MPGRKPARVRKRLNDTESTCRRPRQRVFDHYTLAFVALLGPSYAAASLRGVD
jgi:hypothetical protein